MKETTQSNSEKVKELIQSFTGTKATVVGVPSELIHFIGDTKKGLVLAQIIFSSDKGKRTDGFIFKTYDEMFELTGIKEATLRSYYNEFKEKGFFDWKIKKANAFPTVYFKFDMSKFRVQFLEFLGNRYLKNRGNETAEIEESLTKNTNKDSINLSSFGSKTLSEVTEKLSHSSFKGVDLLSYPTEVLLALKSEEAEFLLPQNFRVTLENLFWAISNFSDKSPKLITERFINYYRNEKGKNVKSTSLGWQSRWRDSFSSGFDVKGYDKGKLFEEQREIKNQVYKTVYAIARDLSSSIFVESQLYSILCKEEFEFSKETIDDTLKFLLSEGYFARFFGKCLYIAKIKQKGELLDVTDYIDLYFEWNEQDTTIKDFISDNDLVSFEQICELYEPQFKDSVDVYLKGGIRSDNLIKCDDYYYSRSEYEENEIYRLTVDSRLKELGLDNSFVIDESDYVSNEELQELFTDLYGEDAPDVEKLLALAQV